MMGIVIIRPHITPLQGLNFYRLIPQGVALGCYILPLRGVKDKLRLF